MSLEFIEMAEIREGQIFGLGNPLLDISADVDADFLAKWELPPNSAILADPVKHKDLFDDMVARYGDQIRYTAGGAVQNTMRITQWMVGKPKVCSFTGCIGSDMFGDIMRTKAQEDGVNVLYMVNEEEKTGTCAVCVSQGGKQRSLCAFLGAANTFKKEHLINEVWTDVQKADLYYISGFHLTVSPESFLEIAKYSEQEPNKILACNLSAPFISQFYSAQLLSVLPYVDIVFGNETEADAFRTMKGWSAELSVREIAVQICKLDKVNKLKPRVVVITQGADNIIVVQNDGADVQEFKPTKLTAEQIVDTNAAGDAFVGGYLSQLIRKKSLATCIKAATYAATEIIQQQGCTLPAECKFVE